MTGRPRPSWRVRARAIVASTVTRLPDRVGVRLLPQSVRYDPGALPPAPAAPDAPVRLYIGPVNYAGQGWAWARAAERLPGVRAVNFQYRGTADLGFPADVSIGVNAFTMSRNWAVRHRAAVASGFSHVLVESEKSMFARASRSDLRAEVLGLRAAGVAVAAVCHGSDLRSPRRHRLVDEWSPFGDDDWTAALQSQSDRNHRLLDELRLPVFVSTPDLLEERPDATWLPIVTDPARWAAPTPALADAGGPLRVTHAPSHSRIKGTQLVEPTMAALEREGVVAYSPVSGVPSGQMPDVYAASDVVIEQFRIGTYSVVALEAMAAGRLVVAHVHDQVRRAVRDRTGWELPVVQATPGTLADVLRDVASRRDDYREIARRGPEFVHAVHDGRASAAALAGFLGVDAKEAR